MWWTAAFSALPDPPTQNLTLPGLGSVYPPTPLARGGRCCLRCAETRFQRVSTENHTAVRVGGCDSRAGDERSANDSYRKPHVRAGWRPRQPRWPCTVSEQFPVATENHIDARVSRMQRRARRGGVQGGAGARPPLGWECEDAPGKRSGTARSAREPPGRRRELPEAAGERQGAARSARGPPGSRREPPWARRPNLGAPGTQSCKWIST